MVTSYFRPEVEIWPFRACAMHPAIIIRTVRSLWTWLWSRYHVPQKLRTNLYFNVTEIPFVIKQFAVITGKSLKKTMFL